MRPRMRSTAYCAAADSAGHRHTAGGCGKPRLSPSTAQVWDFAWAQPKSYPSFVRVWIRLGLSPTKIQV